MIPPVDLRPIRLDDAAAIAETTRQGFESFREWAPSTYHPPPDVLEERQIREGLVRPDVWGLIAHEGDAVAGHVLISQARERTEPPVPIPGLCHLWQLFIREPWWGAGLATDLNRLAVEEAVRRRYERMRLRTPAGHARARRFYSREGWETDGIEIPEPLLGISLVEYRRRLPT
jgi:RimJ/RimL family protein N-acetyltransferase